MVTLDNKSMRRGYTAVDLFCGCGGVTEGLKQAGFTVIAAVDNDPTCCETYKLNHPEVKLLQQDIRKTTAKSLKCIIGKNKLDLLVVCAPCQPFSRLNKSTQPDERVHLILQATRFARALKPKYVLFENVPGIAKNSAIISELEAQFSHLGYHITQPEQIDAADYEVPQRRVRCVIVASRKTAVKLPMPITPSGQRKTVRDAIGKLSIAPIDNPEDPLHASRQHSKETLSRMQHISHDGGSRDELPPELVLPCHRKLNEAGKVSHFSDVYGRMRWDSVAPTLTTGCTDVTKGRYTHPSQDRAITLREAALLQTFPYNYHFFGNMGQVARQIGNAVPVNLAKNLAAAFMKQGDRA